jgi:hypothetical protein
VRRKTEYAQPSPRVLDRRWCEIDAIEVSAGLREALMIRAQPCADFENLQTSASIER